MAEHWWIDIDWENPYKFDKDNIPEFGIGVVNLAQLASIRIRNHYDEGWEIRGTFNHGGTAIIDVYKDKENAMEALNLLQRFLCQDEDNDFIDIRKLRRQLEEVGKC